jgi:hypothetical protein
MLYFEKIQTAYFLVSTLILAATIYYIYVSPIKAVEIGRKLDDEKNKYEAKLALFLTLFSHRSSPIHYDFVNALNKIDLVFQDTQPVLNAWRKYYEALNNNPDENQLASWVLLRVELLSAMAISLGYNGLQQTDIQRHYIPVGHQDFLQSDSALREAALNYFRKGDLLYQALLEKNMETEQKSEN